MTGPLVGNWSRPQRLVTALYFLVFFFSLVRRTCGKKSKGDHSELQASCAAVVSFPNARGDRASEWANERAWDEQNHFASFISFAKWRCGRGREFTSFVPNYPPPSFYSRFSPRSRFCCLSVPATQVIKTKFN